MEASTNDSYRSAKRIIWNSTRRAVEECFQVVSAGDIDLQRFAALPERLAREGDDAVDLLERGLTHENERARVFAAWLLNAVLAGRPDLATIELRRRIDDTFRASLRAHTLEQQLWPCVLLSAGTVPTAVEVDLWRLIRSENEPVRISASAALSTIDATEDSGADDDPELLFSDGAPERRVTAAADEHAGRDYAALLRNLERGMASSDPDIAGMAAVAMTRMGVRSKHSVAAVIRALEKAAPPTKFYLLTRLEQLGDAARPAFEAVRSVAGDARCPTAVRKLATRLLGVICPNADVATRDLLKAIASEEPELVDGAAEAFERLCVFPEQAVRTLALHLVHESEPLRIAAAYALAKAGARAASAVPSLVGRIGYEAAPEMCRAIVMALAAIGPQACPALIEVVKENDALKLPIAGQAIVHMGSAGAKALAQALRTETHEWVVGLLVIVLRDMGPDAAVALPELTALLEECDDEQLAAFVITAMFVTGRAGLPQVPALLRCLLYGSDELAMYAARVLREIGAGSIPLVTEALNDAPGGKKQRLVELLGELRPQDATKHAKFARIGNDSIIWTFVQVGGLLLGNGSMSIRDISRTLMADPNLELMGSRKSLSEASIRGHIDKLSEAFDGVELTTHAPRKRTGGLLTDEGKKLLIEARKYLSWKAEWLGGSLES